MVESVALLQTPTAKLDLHKIGGLEQTELSELEELCSRGIQATLTVAELAGSRQNVDVIRDLGSKHRLLKNYYYLAFGRAKKEFDILHGHYTPHLALLYPYKSVIHFQGLAVAELPLYRYLPARFAACHYVFCADWVRDRFHEIYPDIPRQQLHTVYNGADTQAFRPSDTENVAESAQLVFYGGWSEPKGVVHLAEIADRLHRMGVDFVLHFGGSAFSHYEEKVDAQPLEEKVKSKCASCGRVVFPGWLDHADLPAFLQGKQIGVFTSVHEDPFPLTVLEMMAAGLPVVAFDLGGMKESIVHGETGFLVTNKDTHAFAESVKLLIDNPELRIKMGKNARKRVEQYFTWDRHVDQLLEIYEQIIKRNRDRK